MSKIFSTVHLYPIYKEILDLIPTNAETPSTVVSCFDAQKELQFREGDVLLIEALLQEYEKHCIERIPQRVKNYKEKLSSKIQPDLNSKHGSDI